MKRRFLLKSMLASAGMGLVGGLPLQLATSRAHAVGTGKTFVKFFLPGANDGVNTVMPYLEDPTPGTGPKYYYLKQYIDRRPTIHLQLANDMASSACQVDDLGFSETRQDVWGSSTTNHFDAYDYSKSLVTDTAILNRLELRLGLNKNMPGLKGIYDDGYAALLPSVQHRNSNFSHFENRYLIESGVESPRGAIENPVESGWLNRYMDAKGGTYTDKVPAICMDRNVTPSMRPTTLSGGAGQFAVVSTGGSTAGLPFAPSKYTELSADLRAAYDKLDTATPYHDNPYNTQLHRDATTLVDSHTDLFDAFNGYSSGLNGWTETANQIAHLYNYDSNNSGALGMEVVGATFAKAWDTHASQGNFVGTHGGLLEDLDNAISQLYLSNANGGLKEDIQSGDVCILIETEFGRTITENSSKGTDHGRGGCWIVLGNISSASNPSRAKGTTGSTPNIFMGSADGTDPESYYSAFTSEVRMTDTSHPEYGKYLLPTVDSRDVYEDILTNFLPGNVTIRGSSGVLTNWNGVSSPAERDPQNAQILNLFA